MGMALAFSAQADFGALSSAAVNISDVVQKVYVAVDEKGTEAAAVTGITLGAASVPPPPKFKMVVNRPFFVVIKAKPSNAVLFEGRVTSP